MKKMILVLVLAFMFVSCGGDDGTDTNETNDSDDTSSDNTSGDKFPLENCDVPQVKTILRKKLCINHHAVSLS